MINEHNEFHHVVIDLIYLHHTIVNTRDMFILNYKSKKKKKIEFLLVMRVVHINQVLIFQQLFQNLQHENKQHL